MKTARTLLLIVVLIGLGSALSTLSRRIKVEQQYHQVEIATDLVEVQLLPGDLQRNLQALKQAGATSIAVTEPIIGDLLSTGRVVIRPKSQVIDNTVAYRITAINDPVLQAVINDALRNLGITNSSDGTVSIPPVQIAQIPLGFDLNAREIETIQREGLLVVGRAQNFPRAGQPALNFLKRQLTALHIQNVIFGGDEVIGWRGAIDQAAKTFAGDDLHFGSIEFSKQKGSEKLEDKLHGRYIRVHSISGAEMDKFQPASAVERFVRAARERNVRLLYVRLFATNGADALEVNTQYIQDIKAGLLRAGFTTGQAGIVGDPTPKTWELVLMAIGVAAGAVLMLTEYFAFSLTAALGILAGLAVIMAGLCLAGEMGRKIVALASALAFPTWAAARAARLSGVDDQQPDRPGGRSLQIVSHYLGAIMCVVFGGLLIAGLLSGRTFMTQTNQFMGVKLAHLLPIVIVFFVAALGRLGHPLEWDEFWHQIRESLRSIWSTPIMFGYGIVTLFALVILLVVVMRSGNDAGVGVSGLELRFRAVLDQVLYVRPRSKEIFVGFPALWAAIWLASSGEKNWAKLFFVASLVGLVSALNTFCHIHTPLGISLLRVINGVWVGALIGMLLVLALRRMGLGKSAVRA